MQTHETMLESDGLRPNDRQGTPRIDVVVMPDEGDPEAGLPGGAQGGIDEQETIIDDPVRMYLREIGRVSLLKAADERHPRHLRQVHQTGQ